MIISKPFRTLLVANRGEIALRVIRTAKEQGYRTVAVYSEADQNASHVEAADIAVPVGPAAAAQSYLNAAAIIEAARKSGAEAIHPGYGFLSENADFARACAEAGLVFVGPPPSAIELMGNKRQAKLAMLAAGVPCVPGYNGSDQTDGCLLAEAGRTGYPVMIKAAAGGGGRGMRLVHTAEEMIGQIRSARSEALSAFGSDELILEKAVLSPRHIEIQIFADAHGNTLFLGERDCSIQRRHQKVIEEAPSPFVTEAQRRRMAEAALRVAATCQYQGAGTVEFLVDAEGHFYFLEMNTRLQVEHAVTELVTGIDLVAWQLQVAQGEALPLRQEDISLRGHAIEARLCAEDPRQQFLPQTGRVLRWREARGPHRRTDHMLREGLTVTPHYDSLLGKIIAWGENREQARRRLCSMLEETQLLGVENNLHFLRRVVHNPEFLRGEATTSFLRDHFSRDESLQPLAINAEAWALAAVIFHQSASQVQTWEPRRHWFSGLAVATDYTLGCSEAQTRLRVNAKPSPAGVQFRVDNDNTTSTLTLVKLDESECAYLLGGVRYRSRLAWHNGDLYLDLPIGALRFSDLTQAAMQTAINGGNGQITAVMDGAVVNVLVQPGHQVRTGDTLLVLEAMKMEHPLKADLDGIVETVLTKAGEQVKARQLLATVTAHAN